MSAERTPWLLFMPDGTWDGLIWSPETVEEAQRKFARPRRWATMAREGWTVRRGEPGEHKRLLDERLGSEARPARKVGAAMAATAPVAGQFVTVLPRDQVIRLLAEAEERGAAKVRERVEALLHPERGMGVSVYGRGDRWFDETDIRAALTTEADSAGGEGK